MSLEMQKTPKCRGKSLSSNGPHAIPADWCIPKYLEYLQCSISAGPEEALEEGIPMLPTSITFPGSMADPEPTCQQQEWAVAAVVSV